MEATLDIVRINFAKIRGIDGLGSEGVENPTKLT